MKNLFLTSLAFFIFPFIYSSCYTKDTVLNEDSLLKKELIERIDTIRIQSENDNQILSEYSYDHNTSIMKDAEGNVVVSELKILGTVYIDKANASGGRTVLCWTSDNTCYEN